MYIVNRSPINSWTMIGVIGNIHSVFLDAISSHLKTRFNDYGGYKTEFEFARYIMLNEIVLHDMTNKRPRLKLMKKLSLCTMIS